MRFFFWRPSWRLPLPVSWGFGLGLSFALLLSACGGGGSSSSSTTTTSVSNAVAVTVSAALDNKRAPNSPYVSVTVCVPGSSSCQTIDHILVDTGSEGLRLMASAVTLSLPTKTASGSTGTVAECAGFASGYTWGSVRTADLTIGSETASGVALQLMGDTAIPAAPTTNCTTYGTSLGSVSALGANGILGIGQLQQDCGTDCASAGTNGQYYGCTSSSCTLTPLAVASQLQQPVTLFASDNNGTVLELPAVTTNGAATATGQLLFGIGTQSNNALGSATIIKTDSSGYFSTTFNGSTIASSVIDSGSNGLYFADSNIPLCTVQLDFYCPTSTLSLSATISSTVNSTAAAVAFSVANADTIVAANNNGNNALPALAGTEAAGLGFDFGLPFFYGRSVFTAIQNVSTPGGTGPFVAF